MFTRRRMVFATDVIAEVDGGVAMVEFLEIGLVEREKTPCLLVCVRLFPTSNDRTERLHFERGDLICFVNPTRQF